MSAFAIDTYCIPLVDDQSSFYDICNLAIYMSIKVFNRVNPILFGGGGLGLLEISPKLLTKLTWNFQSLTSWLFESKDVILKAVLKKNAENRC